MLSLTGEFVTSHVTLWLAVDLATQSGQNLLKHGLEYLVSNIDALLINYHIRWNISIFSQNFYICICVLYPHYSKVMEYCLFVQDSSVSIRIGVVHNIPSLSGPSHVIHQFLEAMWHSQRQEVVQVFAVELCKLSDSSLVDLAELKALAQDIKVEKVHQFLCCKWPCIYPQGFKPEKLDKALEDKAIDDIITGHMIYSREVLMLQEGQQNMLSNGRVSILYVGILLF